MMLLMKKGILGCNIIYLFILICIGIALPIKSQNNYKVKLTGTVYEYDHNNKRLPLEFAAVSIPEIALGTTSDENGRYILENVPTGKIRMQIQYLGKVSIDTLINVNKDLVLNFTMRNEDFKLKEVTVTATNSRSGKSTSSHISRSAMDHMQATSLYDVMSLMPGGISQNQDMSSAQQINIRQVSSSSGPEAPMNAMGTAIIRDGAPISNNANLSAMSPTVLSGTETPASLAGGASPAGGTDVRSISTENIESIQIVRGIPSVEYGDLTSGAVIINTKAGREPLRVKAKANPNIYQVSMGTGFELGKKKGALNVSADYAYNTNNPISSYQHYQRATTKLLYSNTFFNNKLRTNSSFDFIYGKENWKNLNLIGMTQNYREINGEVSIQEKFYISDLKLSAKEFAYYTKGHWSIENNLHWILDVHFREDWSLCKKENALKNLSLIRKICYNLTKLDPINTKLSFKKKLTLYNHNLDNIKRLIFNVIPSEY